MSEGRHSGNFRSHFPRRYFLLDILRGLASLVVVISHYKNFFYSSAGELAETFVPSTQPFYWLLGPFYENGPDAVYLFYSLSGFIFFHLYLTQIKESHVGAGEFFLLRFSRLYPLHFLTLIFVAVMQVMSLDLVGDYTVYPFNDLKHFMLNLTFISHWGFEDGWSFNAPIWSVSIEILLYGIFFLFAKRIGKSLLATILMVVIGVLIMGWSQPIGLGVFCFYLGGAVSLIYEDLRNSKLSRAGYLSISVAAFLGALWLFIPDAIDPDAQPPKLELYGAVFPTLILMLACIQDWNHMLGRRWRVIGDITYSTYLLHFPLQLAVILAISYFGIAVNFLSPLMLFVYLAAVVGVSILSFKYIEMPAQKYLRSARQRRLVTRALAN